MTSVINGCATGTLTAGNDCYGIGAVSGSGSGPEKITSCTAENVRIAVGDNAYLVGGIVGYAGDCEDGTEGLNVTAINRCAVNGVEIDGGEGVRTADGIIGGGFHFGEDDASTVFTIADCESDAMLNGGEVPLTGKTPE